MHETSALNRNFTFPPKLELIIQIKAVLILENEQAGQIVLKQKSRGRSDSGSVSSI